MERAKHLAEALERALAAPPPEALVAKGSAACAVVAAARRRLLAAVEASPASAAALAAALAGAGDEGAIGDVIGRMRPPARLRDAAADIAALRRRLAAPDAPPGRGVYEPVPPFPDGG